jgi:putative tricarboxylic transport membrane protein
MEAFVSLTNGLAVAIQPMNLLFALIGVLLGTAVGVLPGIGPALTAVRRRTPMRAKSRFIG